MLFEIRISFSLLIHATDLALIAHPVTTSRINIYATVDATLATIFYIRSTSSYSQLQTSFVACLHSCPFAGDHDFLSSAEQNLGDACNPKPRECDPSSIYYSLDGSCNNLESTSWGASGTAYARLVAANYSDGVCSLRIGSDGNPLPSARKIRTTLLTDQEKSSTLTNILFNGFGQWFTHDVTRAQPATSTQTCCSEDNADLCLPLKIPADDPFYSKLSVTCLEQTRVVNTRQQGCDVSPCLPINFQTGVLDLSILYGADDRTSRALRSFQFGELSTTGRRKRGKGGFPPVTSDTQNSCPTGGIDANSCMVTGDPRINLNPELTMMEVVFLRAHNNIAANLLRHNRSWDDEKTFQEARRVLIAMYKQVVFRELIPTYIGIEKARAYHLLPASSGYVRKYDPGLNPQTIVEYAFAVGRTHHSMTTGTVNYEDSNRQWTSYLLRDKYFDQKFILEKNMFTNLMEAYYSENSNRQSEHFSPEVSNFLFFKPGDTSGSDLPATDINRGLDAGLPPYNNMREACGLPRYSSFEELAAEINHPELVPKLKELYPSVDDVDFYVGGLFEKPLRGALVGPTFACAIGEAAYRWKFGDRLHYEFPQAGFTHAQLRSIRNATFAYLLCLSNPELKAVPKYAFLTPSYYNPLVSCDQVMQTVDFSAFSIDRSYPSSYYVRRAF